PRIEGTAKENYGTVVVIETNGKQLRCIFSHPLKHLYTVSYGKFLLERWVKKVKQGFMRKDSFSWQEIQKPSQLELILLKARESFLCAVDIETSKDGLLITSVAYTFGYMDNKSGAVTTENYVVP